MKISFLSVTIAVSIGLGLGYGAYQAKNRVADFLDRPRFAVVNLNSVVKANEVRVVSQGKRGEEIMAEAERFAKRLKEELSSDKRTNVTAFFWFLQLSFLTQSYLITPHTFPPNSAFLLNSKAISFSRSRLD